MRIKSTDLVYIVAALFVLFYNFTFFGQVLKVYPFSGMNIVYLLSMTVVFYTFLVFLLNLVNTKYTLKPVLIALFLISSVAAYAMDTFQVVINDIMIQNVAETDTKEASDLLTMKFILYFLLLGVLPSVIVYFTKIEYGSFKKELLSRVKIFFGSLLVIVLIVLAFSKFYTSFFREHKPLRYYTNPTYYIYSIGKYIHRKYLVKPIPFKHLGLDAKVESTTKKPKLVIMVVGEAARAADFELNGYKKKTNPNLITLKDLIDFDNVYSCGTETAVSVPCMFSRLSRSEYKDAKAKAMDSVIDVLDHAKINLLWRDNNSDSKGVATRIKNYVDVKHLKDPKYCKNGECYDMILLKGLQKFVDSHKGDIFIVLHQKGSHGPAYYKRVPKSFEKFKPICKSKQLEKCTKEEIKNSYDNTILYTDYFLSQVIKFLKKNSKTHATAMLYMADHGESLGENGIYLHSMPYFIAPDYQKHIGAMMWLSDDFKKYKDELEKRKHQKFSQDNLFDSILGIMDVKTKVYDKKLDVFHNEGK
ncbi:MAG: phosphoethanolamine--lipid A transferase [Epsilonproteobacteria bacterium]|nr:phosphoethanolamine--lipid A transferase [Campylobacterota bacterium]